MLGIRPFLKESIVQQQVSCSNRVKWSESSSVVSDSFWPHGLYSPWDSPGQNTGIGSLSLLQGIFPTQRSNPSLLHCRQILYQLSQKGYLKQSRPSFWEKAMATHSSILAWRIPGTEEPGGLTSMRSHKVGQDWSDLAAAAAEDLYFISCTIKSSSVWLVQTALFAQKVRISILQTSCSTLACSANKTKRKLTELDKIFATKASNRRLISKICK